MTIQAIINSSIKRLKNEGKLLTPDAYAEVFCKEVKRANMSVEDCTHVTKFTKTLNKEFQKDLKNYRISSMNELTRFLIAKLNRTNSSQATDIIDSQTHLTKRILQVVMELHNKEASELAKSTIEMLEYGARPEQLDDFRQRWVNFLTLYDDTFLEKLKEFGPLDRGNLKKSIEALNITEPALVTSESDLEKISKLLVSSFVPSIASSVNETIAELSEKIRINPLLLESDSIEKEIKQAISLRISLDKESVQEMIGSIDGVLDKLSLRLIDMIEKSDSSNDEIKKIKKELESYTEESTTNFKVAHKKLYTIAIALEENTEILSQDLQNHSTEVSVLSKKIHMLEKELDSAKQESKEDFLTKLYNRRALDDFLAIKDAEYERYGHNYSVVMFDLDKFKNVNDTYGHTAGDGVLSSFAKILKKDCRSVDVVGRYGGEEFLAILSETDSEGGVVFAEKVRKHVKKARFMFKGERINVTVSSGVAERKKHVSMSSTISEADELLYVAKTNGRDRVESKK